MDKATILSDATRYVKDLQEKLKAHQDSRSNSHHQNIESVTLAKKPRIAVPDDEDGGSPLSVASVPVSATTGLPEIEARISEGNVMVRIHCEDVKGSLLRLLVELEGLHLTIVHANAMPFSASTLIVNIMAKASSSTHFTFQDGEFIVLSRLRFTSVYPNMPAMATWKHACDGDLVRHSITPHHH
jgi:hypothetical protein